MTYILHPTYANSVIKVIQPPFSIARLAWGYFDVTMKIKFYPKYGLDDIELVHGLKFRGGGLKKSVMISVDDPKASKALKTDKKQNPEFESDKAIVTQIAKYVKGLGGKDKDNNL